MTEMGGWQRLGRMRAALSAGALLALLCCAAPLLLGAACLLALGLASEIALAVVLLLAGALATRRRILGRRSGGRRLQVGGRR